MTFTLSGSISFCNVLTFRAQAEKYIQENNRVDIDLSQIKEEDASLFSLFLCLQRFAKKKQCELTFSHMPQSLQRMQKMFGFN